MTSIPFHVVNLKDTIKVLNEPEVSNAGHYNINLLDKVKLTKELSLSQVEHYNINLLDKIKLTKEFNLSLDGQHNINLLDKIKLTKVEQNNNPFNNKVVRKLYLKDKQTNTIKELLTLKDTNDNLIHKRVDLSYYNYIPEPGLPDPALLERHKETWALDVENIPSAPVPPVDYDVGFLGFTDNLDTKELVDFNTYIVPKVYQDFYAIWSRDILPKFNLFDKIKLTKELNLSLVEQYLISLFDTILLTKEFEATQIEQHVLDLVDKIKLNTNLSVSKVEQYVISLYDKIRLTTTYGILKVEQYVTNLKDTIKVLNELEVSKVEQYNINLLDKVRINLEANLDKVEQYLISLADIISLSTEENLTKVEQYNIDLDDRIELLNSIDISKVEQYITNLTDNIDLNTLTNLIKVEQYITSLEDSIKISKEALITKIEQYVTNLTDETKLSKEVLLTKIEQYITSLEDTTKLDKDMLLTKIEQLTLSLVDSTKLNANAALTKLEQYITSLEDTTKLSKEVLLTKIEQLALSLVDSTKINKNLGVIVVEIYPITLTDNTKMQKALDAKAPIVKPKIPAPTIGNSISCVISGSEYKVSVEVTNNHSRRVRLRVGIGENYQDKITQAGATNTFEQTYAFSNRPSGSIQVTAQAEGLSTSTTRLILIGRMSEADIGTLGPNVDSIPPQADINTFECSLNRYYVDTGSGRFENGVETYNVYECGPYNEPESLDDSEVANKTLSVTCPAVPVLPTLPTPTIAANATCSTTGYESNPTYTFRIAVTNTASVQVRMYVSIDGVWQSRLMNGNSTYTFTRSRSTPWGAVGIEAYSTADGYKNSETITVIRSVSCPLPNPDPQPNLTWQYNGPSSQPFCLPAGYNPIGTSCSVEGQTIVVSGDDIGRPSGCYELICKK